MPDTLPGDLRTVRAHLWGISYDFSTLCHTALQMLEPMSNVSWPCVKDRLSFACFCASSENYCWYFRACTGLWVFRIPWLCRNLLLLRLFFFCHRRKAKNQSAFCAWELNLNLYEPKNGIWDTGIRRDKEGFFFGRSTEASLFVC